MAHQSIGDGISVPLLLKRWKHIVIPVSTCIAIAAILITCFAERGEWRNLFPVILGPVIGIIWFVMFVLELGLASRSAHKNFLAVPFFALSYIVLISIFGASYLGWNKLFAQGHQVVCEDGCVKGYGNMVYYALVNGTTLGYGDFTPQGWSRLLVCIQMAMFVGFLTVALIYIQHAISPRALEVAKKEFPKELGRARPTIRDKEY